MYTDTHTSPQTSLSLSLTHHSLQSQFPSRSSVTRQLSPGLRTPYEIIPMPTLPLWFPWQPGTEQWSCQVTEGQVIGECVCVCVPASVWMCTRVIVLCVCVHVSVSLLVSQSSQASQSDSGYHVKIAGTQRLQAAFVVKTVTVIWHLESVCVCFRLSQFQVAAH